MSTTKEVASQALKEGLQTIVNLQQRGNINKAIEQSLQLLADYPDYSPLVQNLGLLYLNANQPREASEYLQQAIKINPKDALSYNFAGIALCQLGDIDNGIAHYNKALKLNPKLTETMMNLGIASIQKNDLGRAKKYLMRAHEGKFVSPILYYNLGYIEHKNKNFDQAIIYYQNALSLDARYLKCAVNLGEAFFESERFEEANKLFEQLSLALPHDKNIQKKLGVTLIKLSKFDQAIVHLNKGFDPAEEDIYVYLASAYAQTHDLQKEYEILSLGLKHFPNNPTFLITLIILCRKYFIWEHLDDLTQDLVKLIPNHDYLFKYPNYYIFGLTLEEEQLFARKISAYFKQRVSNSKSLCHFDFKREPKAKLKIGYMSSNIKSHPNAQMIADIFNTHSREGFEYYLYATEEPDSSSYAKNLMSSVDHFVNLSDMDCVEAAKAIYKEGIDILIDLSAYHNVLSSEIVALHPSPIVIGFLEHCGTRGADYIDYMVTDRTVTHPEETHFYDEKLIFLPDSHFIANDLQIIAPVSSRRVFKLPEDKFIFTCFNSNVKYDPKSFLSWMNILKVVPNSVLLLWVKEGSENLKKYAQQEGIDPERIIFGDGLEKSVHLARLQLLDLFVDSFDCSAHCTAIDSLWANLPIVTLYGKNVSQRGASSIVKALGMDELIAYSIEEYEYKIIELATNPDLLKSVRAKIATNKATYPLFNCKRTTTFLEKAFVQAHENYLNGKPEHIFL